MKKYKWITDIELPEIKPRKVNLSDETEDIDLTVSDKYKVPISPNINVESNISLYSASLADSAPEVTDPYHPALPISEDLSYSNSVKVLTPTGIESEVEVKKIQLPESESISSNLRSEFIPNSDELSYSSNNLSSISIPESIELGHSKTIPTLINSGELDYTMTLHRIPSSKNSGTPVKLRYESVPNVGNPGYSKRLIPIKDNDPTV